MPPALGDRAGRRAGKPVAALLSDDAATRVPVNATLSATDRAGAARQAAAAAQEGFGCLKLKVGLGDDAGRVAAVRAAVGPRMALRLDANGAWGVEEAVAAIEVLSSRCGGIAGLLAAAALVRSTGAEVYLASTLDGPLGVAAALHAAAALASRGSMPHCGLATLGLFAGLEDPLAPRAGSVALPSAPGLGVEPF